MNHISASYIQYRTWHTYRSDSSYHVIILAQSDEVIKADNVRVVELVTVFINGNRRDWAQDNMI